MDETEVCESTDDGGGGGVLENTLESVREARLVPLGDTERGREGALPGKARVELDRDARENIFPTNEFARPLGPFFELGFACA